MLARSPDQGRTSGHEFTPFDENGNWSRTACARPGEWRGLWQCREGHTHTILVCDECRRYHDADAQIGIGAQLMWVNADV